MNDMLRSNVKNYYSNDKIPNLKMCGKTGTAEVARKPAVQSLTLGLSDIHSARISRLR